MDAASSAGIPLKVFLRLIVRQSRGAAGRLGFFVACIAVGVAALVGVDALVEAMEAGLAANSRELLGGDVELESRRPLPDVDPLLAAIRPGRPPLPRVDLMVLPTMVRGPSGQSHLAEVTAVDERRGGYPLVGRLHTDPDGSFADLVDDAGVVVTPALASELGVARGDTVHIGGESFTVRATVVSQPKRLQFSFAFGPGLLMSRRGLERAGLLGFGSRVRYRTLLSLPAGGGVEKLHALKDALVARLPGAGLYVNVETHDEAQPAIRDTVERVQRYLALVALLSLLLGSVGVAQIVATWLAQSQGSMAVLRCLGFRPRDVFLLYLGQVVATAAVGSLLGSIFGLLVPRWLSLLYPELIPPGGLAHLPIGALATGLAVGTSVALVFCVPPLTAVWRVSPARVLRSDAAPLPVPSTVRAAAAVLTVLGVYGAAVSQVRDGLQALAFTGGVVALTGVLLAGARVLIAVVARLPRASMPALLWQGSSALTRPGAGTTGSIVALGLGTLVVLSITLVEGVLGREIGAALPTDAPSVFLADVQPDQWEGVVEVAKSHGARTVSSAPVVTARLAGIDGRSVPDLLEDRSGSPGDPRRVRWLLTREQRISWVGELPESNALVTGRFFADAAVAEVSVEDRFARDLGLQIGSRLTLDVQGVPMTFTVTSIRHIEWRSFSPNFFVLVEPGYLEDAPQFRIGAMRLAVDQEQPFQDAVTDRFPNVTVLRVRAIIDEVSALLSQAAVGVRLLGAFAVLTGLIILAGAVAATQLRRGREAALLKTLGVTRARVAAMFAWEYALRGGVAGLLGGLGAFGLAYAFTSQVLDLRSPPDVGLCIAGVLATTALSVAAGLLASAGALAAPPWRALRQD